MSFPHLAFNSLSFSAVLLKDPFDQVASRATLPCGFSFKPVSKVFWDVDTEATSPHNSSEKYIAHARLNNCCVNVLRLHNMAYLNKTCIF